MYPGANGTNVFLLIEYACLKFVAAFSVESSWLGSATICFNFLVMINDI
jgi:hypothetical protein